MMNRRRRSLGGNQRGFVLIALIALLAMGGLYFFVSNLTPELLQARQQQKTNEALTQAREALIGYALQYREQQMTTGTNNAMYGFLPMPDVGTSKFNSGQQNPSCNTEGCAMSFINGAFPAQAATIVGRLPWRTLGMEPLRDGHGECLWYIVSAHHKSLGIDTAQPMNWDALGQIDIVTTNDTDKLQSLVASPHDRPLAIIFSPGPSLGSQNRGQIGSDVVTECGGNYTSTNYLEPSLATALLDNSGGTSSASMYFSGTTSTDTSSAALAISTQDKIFKDGTTLKKTCPVGSTNCTVVANDMGLTITSDTLFGAIRKNAYFRTDINAMLDRMTTCLRDQFAAGGSLTLDANSVGLPASPADKTAGRIPDSTCYDHLQNPLGYFSHYRDQFFVAKPASGPWTVKVDGVDQTSCSAVLIFAGQRGIKSPVPIDTGESLVQLRTTDPVSATNAVTNRNWPANYLEGANLAGFTAIGTPGFAGPSLFAQVSANQAANQDIVRCIPAGASLNQVSSPVLTGLGLSQLTNYDAATRTLTLGAAGVSSTQVGAANTKALFGCSWTPESHSMGNGLRSYFKFNISNTGEGFTFAIIDGDRNPHSDVCGAAQQHLGYSGNNTFTPFINYPKIGIEIDTTETTSQRNAFNPAAANTLTNGRSDPNYTGGHVAIVYWGGESPIATGDVITSCNAPKYWSAGACYLPQEEDDNVHGLPTPPDASPRPSPRNPAAPATPATAPAGVYKLDPSLSSIPTNKDIHVRVEVSKVAVNSLTSVRVATQSNINLTSPGTTLDGIPMANGDRVLVTAQSTAADNGIYSWNGAASPMTRTADANTATAMLEATANVSAGTTNAGTTWRQTATVNTLGTDNISWSQYVNHYLIEAWVLADSVTVANQVAAMQNTSRPMSQLYPGFTPQLRDLPLIYDVQGGACPCSTSQVCGSDNICYTAAFQTARLGFTNSQSTAAKDQIINITNFTTTWLP